MHARSIKALAHSGFAYSSPAGACSSMPICTAESWLPGWHLHRCHMLIAGSVAVKVLKLGVAPLTGAQNSCCPSAGHSPACAGRVSAPSTLLSKPSRLDDLQGSTHPCTASYWCLPLHLSTMFCSCQTASPVCILPLSWQQASVNPTETAAYACMQAGNERMCVCSGLRMEDPMLPVPRFTPTVRKFRPQPIDLKEGLKKVKVRIGQRFAECHACMVCG